MNSNLQMLRQIQENAVTTATSTTELLRRCQVFAARMGLPGLDDWVGYELNGYPPGVELPEYRVFHGIAKGNFLGPFGSGLRNAVLPASNLPEDHRDWGRKAFIRQPIVTLEDGAQGEGNVSVPWPGDLIVRVQHQFYEGMSLGQAWLEFGRADMLAAVEAVRNRILTFALDAERYVEASSETSGAEISAGLAQSFHTHIYGTVNNLAQGSTGVSQHVGIAPGDLAGLVAELDQLGIPAEDVESLEEAIAKDGVQPKGKIGARAADWVGKMVTKAIAGVGTVSTNTASTVLPKLLERFYS